MNRPTLNARPRALAFAAAAAILALFVSAGCTKVPPPDSAGTVERRSTARSTSAQSDPVAQKALAVITGASTYDPKMNARIVEDGQRLQPGRPGTTVAIRINRDGAPVDLNFLRGRVEIASIAFGTRDGRLLRVYDNFMASDGTAALSMVEQFAKTLPSKP